MVGFFLIIPCGFFFVFVYFYIFGARYRCKKRSAAAAAEQQQQHRSLHEAGKLSLYLDHSIYSLIEIIFIIIL